MRGKFRAGSAHFPSSGADRLHGTHSRKVARARRQRPRKSSGRRPEPDGWPQPFRNPRARMGIMSAARIVILCEDEQTACFARRFLKARGYGSHDLREEKAPVGKGSAEQWVRERFPLELRAYRAHPENALFVFTDADGMTIEDRIKTLESRCNKEGAPIRSKNESVMLMVPERNIETWLAYLRGRRSITSRPIENTTPKPIAETEPGSSMTCAASNKLREPAPSSLQHACDEFRRFERRD